MLIDHSKVLASMYIEVSFLRQNGRSGLFNPSNFTSFIVSADPCLQRVSTSTKRLLYLGAFSVRTLDRLLTRGGGIRALSEFLVLEEVMHRIKWRRISKKHTSLPCNYFDLIGGTSTGGFVSPVIFCLAYSCTIRF